VATKAHGHLLASDAGELVGVSGTTIGQWARHGYIRASQSDGEPHVYSVEDIGEAAIVAELLARGVRHGDVRRAIERLRDYGDWPLSGAQLATTREPAGGRPRIILREGDVTLLLGARGWQAVATPTALDDVRLRLHAGGGGGGAAGDARAARRSHGPAGRSARSRRP
jgi:DNA-binding transcriptional MerR regulator